MVIFIFFHKFFLKINYNFLEFLFPGLNSTKFANFFENIYITKSVQESDFIK